MSILVRSLATAAAASLLLAGCGGGDGEARGEGEAKVTASFYPLQYVTQRIAGDRIVVGSLTASGAEPHDLELTPRQVGEVTDADLVVYLGGFQPSVDEAVSGQAAERGLDVAGTARLDLEGHEHEEGEEHAEGEEEHAEGAKDPHFWLDPTRLSDVAGAVAERLEQVDPDGADTFRTNLTALQGDLKALDEEFGTGLKTCASRNLVTSHEAFGYLAQRYELEQVGISGISPEQEPDAAELARVSDFVRANKVRTIYTETLASPAIARTVATETGAQVDVLDPIEGLTDASQGRDYLEVMRSDLANLRKGQSCT